ncbi:SDR family oxidoreductase [Pseudomonas denitrificans (nom. rej.)]|uniref:SDR family oxidoreductase n=1 Tax=Pseudomonas denitrificans TaxID=43306 RepID=A0A9X7MZ79_PSEDE|nr:SDR family oxidoreductase [Pseudomonas denitrificans (nom. rej.)]QEY72031.1 SDR family oxidoreductase [Pseudomonas denitrificans (nom. rej.)]
MNVFITGATGWVGSVIVRELIQAGHQVSGLVRSESRAAELVAAGAKVIHGTLDDLQLLTATAAASDAVIHTAFNHDFSRFVENAEQDRLAIRALGQGLTGSGRRLIVTSGVAVVSPGNLITEDMHQVDTGHPRRSEFEALAVKEQGVQVSVVRLAPTVHGAGDHGFVPTLIELARRTGVSAFLGDGANRWPAVHRLDAGRLYRLILDSAEPGFAYHAVAEQGVQFREIAEVIGRRLGLPVESRPEEYFGWFARFAGGDFPTSSDLTQRACGWHPDQPGLIDDLDSSAYFSG